MADCTSEETSLKMSAWLDDCWKTLSKPNCCLICASDSFATSIASLSSTEDFG